MWVLGYNVDASSGTPRNKKLSVRLKGFIYYEQPGTYKVLGKVVDIFGNDTTKMVEVQIR